MIKMQIPLPPLLLLLLLLLLLVATTTRFFTHAHIQLILTLYYQWHTCLVKEHSPFHVLQCMIHVSFLVTDTDECQTSAHRCFHNQICVNTQGSYSCACPRGYRTNGPGEPCVGKYMWSDFEKG